MDMYEIISPANEHDLGEELRTKRLTARVLPLVVRRILDELSIRRGDEAAEEEMDFRVDALHLDRPTAIMGEVAVAGALRMARIDALGENEDDRQNKLQLVVISDD